MSQSARGNFYSDVKCEFQVLVDRLKVDQKQLSVLSRKIHCTRYNLTCKRNN